MSLKPKTIMAVAILLVEDDEQVRTLLRGRLVAAGYAVAATASAEEAITWYRTHPVDLVITDIVLPGKSGLELIDELQMSFPGVRVVAMSGALESDVPGLLRQSRDRGVVYGLPKPFTTTQLLEAIEQTLAASAMSPTLEEIGQQASKRLAAGWGMVVAVVVVVLGLILTIVLFSNKVSP